MIDFNFVEEKRLRCKVLELRMERKWKKKMEKENGMNIEK